MFIGIDDFLTGNIDFCESCVETNSFFVGTRDRAKQPLELVHSDICGPMNVPTHDDKNYFSKFIDDYSHNTALFLMSTKDELYDCFLQYKSMAESHFGRKIFRLHN